MKKLKLFFACLLMAVLSIGQVWGVTFTAGTDVNATKTITKDGVTLTLSSGCPNLNGYSEYRIYASNSFTISSSSNITNITVTTNTAKGNATKLSVTSGYSATGTSGTWSGTSNSVEFSASEQVRVTEISVTISGGDDPTPTCVAPTFDPEDGEKFEESIDVEINAEDGATIYYTTDGNAPTTSSSVYSTALHFTETTTLKAMAVKAGSNNSAVATATYTKIVTVPGYAIDFESELDAYVDWEFSNIGIRTSTITAHGGTYYGSNVNGNGNATSTAAIKTKAKVATPGVLTFYISKESNNTTASSWKAQVSADGSEWTDVETFDAKSMSKGAWNECTADLSEYSNVYVRIYYEGSQAIRAIDDIELAMASDIAKPSISGTDNFLASSEISMTCLTAGAEIYYTLDGSDPKSGTKYTAAFSIEETKTIKAIAKLGSNWSQVAEATFTKATVMTVAQALAANPAANKYVAGIVASVTEVSTEHGNATYTLKDAGEENSIIIYRGKYINNADFTTVDQIEEGDEVTVFGEIKKYSEVNQFTTGNYIVTIYPKARLAWSGTTAGVFEASLEGANTFPTLVNSNGVTVEYSSSNTDAATINASTGEISLVGVGSTTITANFTGNPSFKANSVSYTLNVSSSVIKANISFECNGATSCPETMLAQSNLPSPLPAITKAGKNFGGWWTTETFEAGSEAVAGAAVESTDAITLYAKWLDPYSVTEALSIINALADGAQTESSLYVAGIVSTAPTAAPSSGKLTFFISVNGEAENQLQAYNSKDLGNVGFDSQDDIQVGDEVTIFGPLKKFIKNEEVIPEFNTGYLYAFNRPVVPSISADPVAVDAAAHAGQSVTITYENWGTVNVADAEATLWDNEACDEAFSGDWISNISFEDPYSSVSVDIAANTGAARTAYMKIYALGDDATTEAVKVIAISQEAYVAPALPASLPFAFDGGRADIATTQGMSQEGLDTDYASSPLLKFKTAGAWVIIWIDGVPGKLTYDIKGNSFSGGTFKVQESADGETYTDVAEYTELGEVQSEEQTLLQATRFVKFIYTNKVNGNVALGNIAIAAPVAVETPTFSPAGGEYEGEQTVTISCETVGATIYYTTDGTDPTNESTQFTSAITVDESKTIKAIAYKGDDHSEIASATYTITPALTDYYEKVTSGDVAEGTYLIVYETGSLAFNGGLETLDAVSNTIAVDITNENKIGVTPATAAATFYIDPTAGTIKSASGRYIGRTANTNGLNASETEAYTNTISIDGDGNAVIVGSGSTATYLRYNPSQGQTRFRYFTQNQQLIALYKLANEVIKPASGLAWDPADDIELTVGDALSAPALLNPNNIPAGEITIESSNTDVATVSEGVVSLVENGIGTTTISATYTGETYKPITVSYKIKVNPAYSIYVDKLNVNFGSVEKNALVADKTITVTLTNVAAATATLAGDGASAFSIDPIALTESGNITISANSATVGTYAATITISDDAGNAESKVVNLSLIVTEPAGEETPVSTTSKWVAATDADLVDGAEVLITGVKSEVTYAMAASSSNGNNRTAVAASVDGEGVLTPGENTMSFILVAQGDGTFALRTSNGKYLYAASSSANQLKTRAAIENGDAKWTLSATSAVANGDNTHKMMQFNGSSTIFACYTTETTTQSDIQLYVPQTTPPTKDLIRGGLSNGKWGTLCPAQNVENVEGAEFFLLSFLEEKDGLPYNVVFDQIEGPNLQAGKPYFFIANAEEIRGNKTGEPLDAADPAGVNGFYGYIGASSMALTVWHDAYDEDEDNTFVIHDNKVVRINQTGTMLPSERCYININKEVPSRTAVAKTYGRRRITVGVSGTNAAQGFENLDASEKPLKVMIEGTLYILRGEKVYDATGRLVK